jgi:serine/threonine-protein kinase
MAKVKVDVFIDLLRNSGLVEKDRFNAALADILQRSGGNLPTDVDDVAKWFVDQKLITQWQAERLLEGRHKGFFLGKYKLLNHLGTGGMSCVYLAEHVLMQRRVAIKVLPKNRVEDTSYLARFHREAQAAAALDHRNIVRAYDVDVDDSGKVHYMVMEYIEGRDVQRMVKDDGPLDFAHAADFTRQAAEGLAHAHQANLIHRDVKPANLLVDPKNVIKVLDLGLARFTDEKKASLTVAYDENVLGTADYLAPEQAIDSHRVDHRADIYSLGCTLYFMLTGHPPFPKGTLPQRLMMHQKQPPPSIFDDRPDAPADLVAICMKMMAKKPDQRYQSAAAVASALHAWQVANGCAGSSSGSVPGGSGLSGGGSSSGNLVGAGARATSSRSTQSSGVRKSAQKPVVLRSKSSEGGGRSPKIPAVVVDSSPSFIDTSSDLLLRPIEKEPDTRSHGKPSDEKGKRSLPVAKPLNGGESESVIDDELPAAIAPFTHSQVDNLDLSGWKDTSKRLWMVVITGVVLALLIVLFGLAIGF